TTSLVVPQEDLFQFKYRMSAKDLEMNNCDDEKICYDCYYDLEIRISGGCITPIVEKRTNLTFSNPGNVPNVDLDCLTSASAITAEFDVTLPEGEYDVVKILTVSKRAQDHYRENIFLQNNICKTLQEFIDERTPVMQAQFPCNITCASCTTSLGTYQQYRSAFLTQQGINPLTTVSYENEIKASYDEGMKACDALCKGADNVVASIENAMLDDMTPDEGQYARLDLDLDDDNIINPGEPFNDDYGRYEKYSNRPWNIFNADRYKSPLVQYHNEYGEVEPISVKAFTPQELADNFKAAWAKDLLPLHPEYNKLQKVKQLLLPSYSYDKILRETNTWTEANNNHFIEEVISTGSGTGIVTADPFFSLLPAYSITIKKYIGVDFDVYPNPTPKSLWSMAWMAVMCNSSNTATCLTTNLTPSTLTGISNCEDYRNRIWRIYRDLYLTQKERMINEWLQIVAPVDYSQFAANKYERRFGRPEDYYTAQMTAFVNTAAGGTVPDVDINGLNPAYAENCEAYKVAWTMELKKCLAGRGDMNTIIAEVNDALKNICVKGSDINHPFGSSTIAPGMSDPYGSFTEAIRVILANHLVPKSALCHPDMITFPQPYDLQMPLSDEPTGSYYDECVCNRLTTFTSEYAAADPDHTIFANFIEFMQVRYNVTLTEAQIQELILSCGKTCKGISGEISVTLPAIFSCLTPLKTCIDCEEYLTYKQAFENHFPPLSENVPFANPADDDELNANIAFANYMNNKTGFNKSWTEYFSFGQNCFLTRQENNASSAAVVYKLCSDKQIFPITQVPAPTCTDDLEWMVFNEVFEQYQLYVQQQKDDFDKAYLEECLNTVKLETFTVTSSVPEYHYTLYYYDQAGNLVKTIPPEGVRPDFSPGFLADVKNARENQYQPAYVNQHTLATQYCYNALNQVTRQYSPDGGESEFWYDQLGRLVVSQNAKQKLLHKFSYTRYDELGRITEVGEKTKNPANIGIIQVIAQGQDPLMSLETWLTPSHTEPNNNITHTIYDLKYDPLCTDNYLCQQNLRNRVSYSYVQKEDNGDAPTAAPWESATFYTYDIHGNVDVLLQDYKNGMGTMPGGNRYKKIAYKYDLISGKVNEVAYQPGAADAFYHRYSYDAENKLTEVYTSKEYVYWEREASYKYYRHGPLGRTVLGKYGVQGIDYAYTLQGWLKGVNTTGIARGGNVGDGADCGEGTAVELLHVPSRLVPYSDKYVANKGIIFEPGFESLPADDFTAYIDPLLTSCGTGGEGTAGSELPVTANNGFYDMGRDGLTGPTGLPINTTNTDLYGNNVRTTDAYGYSLNYFSGDYTQIDEEGERAFLSMTHPMGDETEIKVANQLYNGNIAAMLVSIPKLGDARVYGYRYDQLNRITDMIAYKGVNGNDNSFSATPLQDYREAITYDANGNIKTYKRNGFANGGLAMDNLYYQYEKGTDGRITSNKLRYVHDQVPKDKYTEDIDSHLPENTPLSTAENDKNPLGVNDNYAYDAIGNLIKDTKEGITNIEWNVYGKIERIQKSKTEGTLTTQTDITYTYDVSGNRISKKVGTTKLVGSAESYKAVTTFYVRDASGNVMSVYQTGETPEGGALNSNLLCQTEVHLYGSSRLGILNTKVDVGIESRTFLAMTGTTLDRGELFTFERGATFFELTNHLGNVLVTITDKRLERTGVHDGNTIVEYYSPDVVTANDYYPFGMLMPGRKFDGGSGYRYGFNGQEKSDEIFDGSTTAEYWEYDSRIGRRWNLDPILKESESPYLCFSGSPIVLSDIDGDDAGNDGNDPDPPARGSTIKTDHQKGAVDAIAPNGDMVLVGNKNSKVHTVSTNLGTDTKADFRLTYFYIEGENGGWS
ncbi:hypothetical protein EGI32_10095, partial [Ferruginibacter sp. HRS2-29]|nr:hypothetical protein [Ferruginibacter sp. HRS2-29]